MTALDRLLAAIPDDGPVPREAQLDLVRDLLSRGRNPAEAAATLISAGETPTSTDPSPAPAEQVCDTCLHELDSDGYCGMCGRREKANG